MNNFACESLKFYHFETKTRNDKAEYFLADTWMGEAMPKNMARRMNILGPQLIVQMMGKKLKNVIWRIWSQ